MAKSKTTDTQDPLIVIASNRGPFSFTQHEDGSFSSERGAGGLVTALSALAEQHDVLWIACALGDDDRAWAKAQGHAPQDVQGTRLKLVIPDDEAYNKYYNTIANPLLWFIQHQLWDATRAPSITAQTIDAWENGYVAMNRLFADAIIEVVKAEERPVIIFPQDYHLYLTPRMLREALGDTAQIASFCHIPWPGPDNWRILPTEMRRQLLDSLLGADRVGFQTKKDAFNFVQTCRFYLEGAHSHGARDSIHYEGRKVGAYAYPISIDADMLDQMTDSNEVRLFKNNLLNTVGDNKLILRTDRIEPSKNILRGLEAFRALLEHHPEHQGRVMFLMLLVPSRMEVDEYSTYLQEIMASAGLINADYSDGFWEPVRVIVGNNYARAIAAMQMYDGLLVNPLADGMNLVAKEGVLVNQRAGVLVLSENAGAFFELGDAALTVSPFDVYGTAEALHMALTMPGDERRERAEKLRTLVRRNDIRRWFHDQTQDALREMASSNQAKKSSTSSVSDKNKSE
ncbi:MAG: trehalose-6-phosphate synthase [Anaerolineales bacterium]